MPGLLNNTTHYARIVKYYSHYARLQNNILIMPVLLDIATHNARIVKYSTHYARIVKYYHS